MLFHKTELMTVSAGKNTLYAVLGLAILSLEALGSVVGSEYPPVIPSFIPVIFIFIII